MTDTAMALRSRLEFHQGDWMRKALSSAGIQANVMAEYLGVEPETVSRWLNGKRTPGKQTLRLWALRTGTPLSYLETGVIPDDPEDGPGQDAEQITAMLLAPRRERTPNWGCLEPVDPWESEREAA